MTQPSMSLGSSRRRELRAIPASFITSLLASATNIASIITPRHARALIDGMRPPIIGSWLEVVRDAHIDDYVTELNEIRWLFDEAETRLAKSPQRRQCQSAPSGFGRHRHDL